MKNEYELGKNVNCYEDEENHNSLVNRECGTLDFQMDVSRMTRKVILIE